MLQGDLDVLVNWVEFHCYFQELSTRRIACWRNLSSKRFQRLRYRSLQSSIAMLIRWENFIMHNFYVITNISSLGFFISYIQATVKSCQKRLCCTVLLGQSKPKESKLFISSQCLLKTDNLKYLTYTKVLIMKVYIHNCHLHHHWIFLPIGILTQSFPMEKCCIEIVRQLALI